MAFLSRLARSAGRATGFVSGRVASHPKRRRRPRTPSAKGRKRVLIQQIADLEQELAQIHARITSGVRGESAGAPDEWIRRARELRDQIHERRLVLIRVERELDRDRRLNPDLERLKTTPTEEAWQDAEIRTRRRRVMRILSRYDRSRPGRRDSAYESLVALGDSLFHESPDVRRRAVQRLAQLDRPLRAALLRVMVEDESDRVRLAALHGLTDEDPDASPVMLLELADDPSPVVRAAAIAGLARTHSRAAVRVAKAALVDGHAEVRRSAALVLGYGTAQDALGPLMVAVHDDEAAVRVAAVSALGRLNHDRAVLTLVGCLADADLEVREGARRSLETTLGPDVNDAIGALGDGDVVEGLSDWWLSARVELGLARMLRTAGIAIEPAAFEDLVAASGRRVARAQKRAKEARKAAPERAAETRAREAEPARVERADGARARRAEPVATPEAAEAAEAEGFEGLGEGLGVGDASDDGGEEEAFEGLGIGEGSDEGGEEEAFEGLGIGEESDEGGEEAFEGLGIGEEEAFEGLGIGEESDESGEEAFEGLGIGEEDQEGDAFESIGEESEEDDDEEYESPL